MQFSFRSSIAAMFTNLSSGHYHAHYARHTDIHALPEKSVLGLPIFQWNRVAYIEMAVWVRYVRLILDDF